MQSGVGALAEGKEPAVRAVLVQLGTAPGREVDLAAVRVMLPVPAVVRAVLVQLEVGQGRGLDLAAVQVLVAAAVRALARAVAVARVPADQVLGVEA
jgi:hypothetical protein